MTSNRPTSDRWYSYLPWIRLRRIEIRHRLIAAFILVSLFPLLVSGYIAFVDSVNAIETKTRVFSTEVVKQVAKNIHLRMAQIDNESASLIYATPVQKALTAYATGQEAERSAARRALTQALLEHYGAVSHINQKYFLDTHHQVVDMQAFAELTRGVAHFIDHADANSSTPQWGSYDNGVGQENIGMVRTIINKNNNEVIGAIFLAINPAHFSAIFDNVDLGGDASIFVMDANSGKVIVYTPGVQQSRLDTLESTTPMLSVIKNDLHRGTDNGFINFSDPHREQYLASFATIPGTSWLVVNTIPKRRLIAEIQTVRNKLVLIGVLCFLFAIALGMIIAHSISSPLRALMRKIEAFGNQVNPTASPMQWRALRRAEGNDELSRLTQSFVVMNDIVHQKIAQINDINATLEQKIIERTAALAASEQESRTLIENSPDTIVRYDLQCRRIFINATFDALTSDGVHSLLGTKPSELPGGANWEMYEQKIVDVIKTGHKGFFELRWTSKNGHDLCSDIRLIPEFDTEGKIVSVMSVGRDITELNLSRAELSAVNVQLAEMNATLESLATHDSLTQLPNRRLLLDRLRRAMPASDRHGRYGAVMFIDLDHFKTINDTLGHDMGDELLIEVAHRLQACVRDIDTVARIGGDEFIVMLENLSDIPFEAASQTEIVGKKILQVLMQPFHLLSDHYHISASIGITLFRGTGKSAEDVLREGDIAMYDVKKSGRNALRFFDANAFGATHAQGILY